MPTYSLRGAAVSDAPILAHICLVTGECGNTAEHLHAPEQKYQDLLAVFYALPYVYPALSSVTAGFVLIATPDSEDRAEEGPIGVKAPAEVDAAADVVGYVLYTTDTRTLEALSEKSYYPALREAYPLSLGSEETAPPELLPEDRRLVRQLHSYAEPPFTAPDAALAFSPAHMHIDLLPPAQGKGWGKRLIGAVMRDLHSKGLPGLWVAIDSRNVRARDFYLHLGFARIEGTPDHFYGLTWAVWSERNPE